MNKKLPNSEAILVGCLQQGDKEAFELIFNELSLWQQMIFKLSRHVGLSHSEIADRPGLSFRSVENQIYRVLKYIKENLGKEYKLVQ